MCGERGVCVCVLQVTVCAGVRLWRCVDESPTRYVVGGAELVCGEIDRFGLFVLLERAVRAAAAAAAAAADPHDAAKRDDAHDEAQQQRAANDQHHEPRQSFAAAAAAAAAAM